MLTMKTLGWRTCWHHTDSVPGDGTRVPPLSVLFIAPEIGFSEGASYLILRTMQKEGGRNVGGVRSDTGWREVRHWQGGGGWRGPVPTRGATSMSLSVLKCRNTVNKKDRKALFRRLNESRMSSISRAETQEGYKGREMAEFTKANPDLLRRRSGRLGVRGWSGRLRCRHDGGP